MDPVIWHNYRKKVLKFQAILMSICWENCDWKFVMDSWTHAQYAVKQNTPPLLEQGYNEWKTKYTREKIIKYPIFENNLKKKEYHLKCSLDRGQANNKDRKNFKNDKQFYIWNWQEDLEMTNYVWHYQLSLVSLGYLQRMIKWEQVRKRMYGEHNTLNKTAWLSVITMNYKQ